MTFQTEFKMAICNVLYIALLTKSPPFMIDLHDKSDFTLAVNPRKLGRIPSNYINTIKFYPKKTKAPYGN